MKRLLLGCGALSLILMLAGAIGFAILAYRGTQLDKESSAYADAALKDIATNWSEKAILDRASPEFKQAVPIDQLGAYFRECSKLGHLLRADSMSGQASISFDRRFGKRIQGLYTVRVQFENAEATITLGLIKHDKQWQIARFEVQAPAYRPQ